LIYFINNKRLKSLSHYAKLMLSDIVSKLSSNVVRIDVKINDQWGNGSGVLIDDKGTILTCDHVVRPQDLTAQYIRVAKGKEPAVQAELIKFDSYHDAALIRSSEFKINGDLKHACYEEVKVGQDCFTLGFPVRLPQLTLTKGTISAKGKGLGSKFLFELIQIDARINRGNSGGPVFMSTGHLIGIVTMKYIPFLQEMDQLVTEVEKLPVAPKIINELYGFDLGDFFNRFNTSMHKISDALQLVQVGIGWVIPISVLDKFLNYK
jgi:S1-C subfamily serine protease